MDHVVPSLADTMEMAVPIVRILAHELGQDGDTGESIQGYARLLDVQARRDIDVEGLRLRWLGYIGLASGEGGKRSICTVEGERASDMNWNVDIDHIVEARLEPVWKSAQCWLQVRSGHNSLVLFERLPIKLLMLAWNVHPQAPLSTYRARAFNFESYTVCWDCRWSEVDVWRISRKIGRAIVFERKEVDGVVVDLLWRHIGDVSSADRGCEASVGRQWD